MSSTKNKSNHYNSYQSLSDIKESIQQYSMNFQKSSNGQSRIPESISQDISVSKTNKGVNKSGFGKNQSKKSLMVEERGKGRQARVVKQAQTQQSMSLQEDRYELQKPKNLGLGVWEAVQERYYETNKISTDDPNVLYDFYLMQRKTNKPRPLEVIEADLAKMQGKLPSMQRKIQTKLQFQKIMIEKPQDVLYTLTVAAHVKLKDRQLRRNQNILNAQFKKTNKQMNTSNPQAWSRLIKHKHQPAMITSKMDGQQIQKIRLKQFGRKLSQTYQKLNKDKPQKRVQTISKLYRFWQQLYDKDEYGLQWDQHTAQKDIRQYIIDQVVQLKKQFNRKVGYGEANGNQLLKFLIDNPTIQEVYIPVHSFQQYVTVYNLSQQQKQQNHEKELDKIRLEDQQKKKKAEIKQFGRPVSATPLNILSKPKIANDYTDLYTKYTKDKVLDGMMREQLLKTHRSSFQYAVFNLIQQLKIKNRVKPDRQQDYDHTIAKMMSKSIANNQSFFQAPLKDRVAQLMRQQNLCLDSNWKQSSTLLHQAMIIKSYQQKWFRDPIVKYLKQTTSTDLQCQMDKIVFKKLFEYLDNLDQQDRDDQMKKLQRFIGISKKIQDNNVNVRNLQKKDEEYYVRQRKLMYADLIERAIYFLTLEKKIREKKTDQKLNRRQFLQKTFQILMKNHRDAVIKYFNVVQIKGDRQCPKLLKYQFFRLLKQINPFTCERDAKPKAPTWVPTKKQPQAMNYKTHNKFANAYSKNKNRLVCDPQPEERGGSLWGRKQVKERERLMMSFGDAKECYFHPKGKKME